MSVLADNPPRPVATPVSTHSALIAPGLALSSCVRAYITRSTVGAELRPDQRLNYLPATPLCGIYWLLQGEGRIVRRGEREVDEPVPQMSFAGPHTLPTVSVNPGPVRLFTLGLVPHALQALAGVPIADYVDRVVPLHAVLDSAWQTLAQSVLNAHDDADRVRLIEAFLAPRWSPLRHATVPRVDRVRGWSEALALQAASSGAGRSVRQMERRIKQWAGQSLRELRRMGRAEASFLQARADPAADLSWQRCDWAGIAADTGYADQSHLCRESRRVTGLSPTELKKAVQEDEGFWMYRLWE